MSLPIGDRLYQSKYTVEQELGRGGFGITYKATNTALNQTVVIKTLNDGLRQDPNFLNHQQQFQAEARRLAKCAHPSIVRVSDFFVEDELPFIVMDYVPGQTLDTVVLPDKPLPEAIALHYIRQVGDAIQTVHHNGLLHRDIKPQNLILRDGTQNIVLIDFGIAREFSPGLTQTHTHLVSEGYAPIEQYLPQAKRSPATDIYGLAATLYTLLTGKVPTAAPLRDRSPLVEPRQLQPGISAAVNEAVMRGMAMEPLHRPATVSAWLNLLPGTGQDRSAASIATSPSHLQTLAVAPAHRLSGPQHTQGETVAVMAPAQTSVARSRWWLPGAVILGTLLPLLLGYSLWRSQLSSSADSPAPPSTSTPSPLVEEAALEEAAPSPTPLESLPLEEPATPLASPTNEPLVEETIAPPPTEQTREDIKRQEELAREAEKRREELAREEAKRQAELAREAKKEGGNK